MSLAVWLDNEYTVFSLLKPQSLMLTAQFGLVRDSMATAQSELPGPAERAEQIIELVQAYQTTAKVNPATIGALWQLGSFMAAMDYPDQAWGCLSHAGALYSQLALAILPKVIESWESSQLAQQQLYYAYRAAALATLAEAVAVSVDDSDSAKSSAMLFAEFYARLLQLRRGWSGLPLSAEDPPAILSTATHALRIMLDSAQDQAYAQPRMRFWWWHYPLEIAQLQPVAQGRRSPQPGRGRRSPRLQKSSQRPKLEYNQTPQLPGPGRRRPGPPGIPAPMLPPTPGSRLGI
jgi:hypothetical protein